jgi:hypothetical protein
MREAALVTRRLEDRMRFIRRHVTYSSVMATLAVFLALGGTAVAAHGYLLNSKKQISPKLLKLLHGAKGARGAQGTQGIQGATGATGATGAKGDPGPLAQTVPSGVTIRGSWGLEGYNANASGFTGASVSYPFRLPVLPLGLVLVATATTAPHCTGSVGSPTADAGYVCVYRGYSSNINTGATTLDNPETGSRTTTSVFGFVVEDQVTVGGVGFDSGTWAYTAP